MIYIDSDCPLCRPFVELELNSGDLFECPQCHLQIAFASFPLAALLQEPGDGEFRENRQTVDPRFHGSLLAPARESSVLAQEKFFKDRGEALAYLGRSLGLDAIELKIMLQESSERMFVSSIQRGQMETEDTIFTPHDFLIEWLEEQLPDSELSMLDADEIEEHHARGAEFRAARLDALALAFGIAREDPFALQAKPSAQAAAILERRLEAMMRHLPLAEFKRIFPQAFDPHMDTENYADLARFCANSAGGYQPFLQRVLQYRALIQRSMRLPFFEMGDIPPEWMAFFVNLNRRMHRPNPRSKKASSAPLLQLDRLLLEFLRPNTLKMKRKELVERYGFPAEPAPYFFTLAPMMNMD
jgi:hypothetical protein